MKTTTAISKSPGSNGNGNLENPGVKRQNRETSISVKPLPFD
jgi:hypothetical protein